jgi:putative flavoprotein involved in K+ transport
MEHADIVIVGGGQSGLAGAHAALVRDLHPVVLTASSEASCSWPRYYDSLKLFSPARYSELPGRAFGGDPDRFPTRDELVEYLRAYAAELGADVRTGQRVTAVTRLEGGGFVIRTAAELELSTDLLIAGTGGFGSPYGPTCKAWSCSRATSSTPPTTATPRHTSAGASS